MHELHTPSIEAHHACALRDVVEPVGHFDDRDAGERRIHIGADLRLKGVISNLDGANVIRVPASRVPEGFGFLLAHPSATVAPVKLESYNTHQNPPGINGQLVEGRVVYDAFVLENKKMALYYQAVPTEEA